MRRIGLISDTHGTFDDTLREFLRDVDEVWHAGDIGSLAVADEIAAFKPLRAVYGNIDGWDVRRVYPEVAVFDVEGFRVLMTHIGELTRKEDMEKFIEDNGIRFSLAFGPILIQDGDVVDIYDFEFEYQR
jgi:putative phosphoesterase